MKLELTQTENLNSYKISRINVTPQEFWRFFSPSGKTCPSNRIYFEPDIEGTRQDMIAIAEAIKSGGSFYGRRCAVRTVYDDVIFYSLDNSEYAILVSIEDAKSFAFNVLAQLKPGD